MYYLIHSVFDDQVIGHLPFRYGNSALSIWTQNLRFLSEIVSFGPKKFKISQIVGNTELYERK